MNIIFDEEKAKRIARALMPKVGERAKFFEILWQGLITHAQLENRDFINNGIKYLRCKDSDPKSANAYFAEAKAHLADAFCQLFLMCAFFDIDPNEVIDFGLIRLENHWKQEILKELGEY